MNNTEAHWTDYVPALILFTVAALIAIVGSVLAPPALRNKIKWMRDTEYVIGEIFSD